MKTTSRIISLVLALCAALPASAYASLIITNSSGDLFSVSESSPSTSHGSLSGQGNLVGVGSWGGSNFAVATSGGTFTVYSNTLTLIAQSSGHGTINGLATTPNGNAVIVTAAGLGINLSGSDASTLASGDWSDGTKSLLKVASFANSDVAMTRSDFGIITANTTQGFVGYNGANDSINQAIVVNTAQTYLVGRSNGGLVGWNANGGFQSFNNGYGDIRALAIDAGSLYIATAAGQVWLTNEAALQNAGDISTSITGLGTITSLLASDGKVFVGNSTGTLTILDGSTLDILSTTSGFGDITGLALVTTAIPEPASFATLAGIVGLGITALRRRRATAC